MTAAVFAHEPTSIRVNFVNNQEILAWADPLIPVVTVVAVHVA